MIFHVKAWPQKKTKTHKENEEVAAKAVVARKADEMVPRVE